MEPRIQYAKTSDGVSIAYWTLGEGGGVPLVLSSTMTAPSVVQWQIPRMRSFYQQLARNRMLVRYDGRGTGMSDREARDFSLDARMRDLEAVVNRLELQRFALYAASGAGRAAVVYAATRRERVSHLILFSSWAGPIIQEVPSLQGILGFLDSDWTLYTETLAHWLLGWSEGELAHDIAAAMRASISHEAAKAAMRADFEIDVRHLLPLVRAPALVFLVRDGPVPVKITQELVAGMPNARLVVLESSSVVGPQAAAAFAAIDEFLGEGETAAAAATVPPEPSAFRTVLFTDLVGHTEMMSRLGDERGREVLREHERITREVLKAHGGTEVKTMGDGFMASFGSVTKAVECAVTLQRAFAEREGEPLSVRVGLNAGEPIEEDGDLFGATVILAARIAAKAEGGEILVANAVRELCAGKGFLFADRGEFVAKGFEEPVRAYEVRWRDFD